MLIVRASFAYDKPFPWKGGDLCICLESQTLEVSL